MHLDLRYHGKLSPSLSILYNEIAHSIRKHFNELISSLSELHQDNIDWWSSSPPSRNVFISPLFHYCCCIRLLQGLIQSGKKISVIYIDSKAAVRMINKYLKEQNISVIIIYNKKLKDRIIKIFVTYFYIFITPIKFFILFFICKYTRKLRKPLPAHPLTLIDIFMQYDLIGQDRYYPGLLDTLSRETQRTLFFVPTWYKIGLGKIYSTVCRVRLDKKNYLLKEDYLRVIDYFFAWGYVFRVLYVSSKIRPALFFGIDISPLVREELKSMKGFSLAFLTLLNYRFPLRLKKSGLSIRFVVNWFENQVVDKGWNMGFHHFLPKIPVVGYQGFIASPLELNIYPTSMEKQCGVLPHRVHIISKALIGVHKEFCPDLEVTTAPAFRYQHLWKKRKVYPDPCYYTILVTLPMMLEEALLILQVIARLLPIKSGNIRFWIKPHPASDKEEIKKAFHSSWSREFRFIENESNFGDWLEQADVLVSGYSSACIETLAKGVPVIIVGNRQGMHYNSIPTSITADIWQFIYTHEDLLSALTFYKNRDVKKKQEHEHIGRKIREEYFEEVTLERVRKFLDI